MRVRYYGYLANVHRRLKLSQIRKALNHQVKEADRNEKTKNASVYKPICRECQQFMELIREIPSQLNRRKVRYNST